MAGLALDASAAKLGALVLFFQNEQDNVIEEAKIKAVNFCEQTGISTEWLIRKRKQMPGEDTVDAGLSLQDENKWEQYEILEQLHEEMTWQTRQISDMNIKFGFLTWLSYLIDPSHNSDIAKKIHHLTERTTI